MWRETSAAPLTQRPNFILAASLPLSQHALMPKVPTITLRIEADLLTQVRFRWLLCEGDSRTEQCQAMFDPARPKSADRARSTYDAIT
jgi:hypothetical protein